MNNWNVKTYKSKLKKQPLFTSFSKIKPHAKVCKHCNSRASFNDIYFFKVVPTNFQTVPTALRENAKVNKLFPSALLEKLDFHFLC